MMKKNLFYIFALMFSFIVLSSANVLAINASFGGVTNRVISQDLYILANTNFTYQLNLTINVTPNIRSGANYSYSDNFSVRRINVTLPAGLSLIAGSANMTGNTTEGGTGRANMSVSGQVITFRNTSLEGINLTNRSIASGKIGPWTEHNMSINLNITATEAQSGLHTITIGVLYNDTATDTSSAAENWNTTTITLNVVDLVNISNRTTLTFNEDATTSLTFSINNTNVANYPIHNGSNTYQNAPITNVTIQFNSLTGAIAAAGANSNSTTIGYVVNSTRFNGTRFGWTYNGTSNETSGDGDDSGTGYLIAPGQQVNFSLNMSFSQPGNWTVTINIYYNTTGLTNNWTQGNFSSKTFTIYDTTAPTNFTYSCTPTSIYQGETLSCPCSAVDNYYVAGGTGLNISVATLEIQATGTYSPVCTALDGNGNSATATSSYTVNSQTTSLTTSTGGAGGGYSGSTTHNVNSLSATESKIITSESQENLKFKITTGTASGTTFKGTIDTVGNDSVTLTLVLVSGSNKELTISSGSTGKVDLDEDGIYDLSIAISGISSGTATLAMKEISETVPVEAIGGEETETTTGEEKETTKAEEPKKNLTWLWATLGAIAVIVSIIFYLTQKKGPVGVFFITLFSKNSGRSFRKK